MRTGSTYSISRSILLIAALAVVFAPAGAAHAQDRPITLHLDRVGLRAAIDTLIAGGVSLVYVDADVRGVTVSVECDGCPIETLLGRMLAGTPLSWRRVGRQYILRKPGTPDAPVAGTLWGTVSDSATGEPIGDAAVFLFSPDVGQQPGGGDRHGAGVDHRDGGLGRTPSRSMPVNPYGFFSFRNVTPGKYRVTLRSVGYAPLTRECEVVPGRDASVAFLLSPEEFTLSEVVVRAERSSFSLAEGISGGVYVPAAPADQNQYFLEGGRVYNPAHQGGVLSTFNDEALNDVLLREGGIPPSYGGRIGGILDLSLREGSMAGVSGVASGGTGGASLLLNGPLPGPTTFLISARSGYPEVGLASLYPGSVRSDARFTEFIGKLTWRTSAADRVSFVGFFGRDAYVNAARADFASLGNRIVWRNASASLRWAGIVLPSLFLQVSSGFTGYDFTAGHDLQDYRSGDDTTYNSVYRVGDVSLRADAEHYYDDWHTVVGGVGLVRHAMSGEISSFSSQAPPLPWDRTSSWELSVYLQDRWRLTASTLAEIGARATNFTGDGGSFSAVDPRFDIIVAPAGDFSFHGSLTSVTQFIHPFRQRGIFLFYPAIFWYPSTGQARPQTALQGSVGTERRAGDGAWTLGVDAYYRFTRGVHEFLPGAAPGVPASLDDAVLLGDEKAYGLRFNAARREGRLTGFLRYDLSWVTQRFDSLNGGTPFVPRFHRRHEVGAGIAYAVGAGVTADLLAVVASDQSPSFRQPLRALSVVGPLDVVDLNGSRLAGFQRIEVGIGRTFVVSGTPVGISIRMLNAYGLIDLFDWHLINTPDIRQKWAASVREASLFPKYPSLNVRIPIGGGS